MPAAAEEGGGLPVRAESIGLGRWWGELVWVEGLCASWVGIRGPEATGPWDPRGKKQKHKEHD